MNNNIVVEIPWNHQNSLLEALPLKQNIFSNILTKHFVVSFFILMVSHPPLKPKNQTKQET